MHDSTITPTSPGSADAVPFEPLTEDRQFRSVFANPRHTDQLAAFLKTVIDDLPEHDWDHLSLTDPHTPPQHRGGKETVMDVRVLTASAATIAVEVQVRPAPVDRFVFYGAKSLTRQLVTGAGYDQVGRAITVVITGFLLLSHAGGYHKKAEWHLVGEACEGRLTGAQVIHFLQLPALGDDDGTPLWRWLKAFAATSWEEMDVIAKTDPDIAKVAALAKLYASQAAEDDKDAHDKWLWDQTWREDTARTEGHAEGHAQAVAQTARNALRAGLPAEQVAQITGLTAEEIRALDRQ
ncbi:MAG: Rpn family recombination-promoting nuclease/putative transposase [Micrococcales bacterium]|nr:Rpn family recombination-promoting nuclease/putative transposase [Micrococcales bacterium]MCL2668361.1 Rpn family recombination-promoting nuclease/putative transposase [Micrococcales bacterium]